MAELHGADPNATASGEYESPEEYEGQGDTRIVRALRFLYTVQIDAPDGSGSKILEPHEAVRGDEVTIDQIGLLALRSGERDHAFYTTEERERLETGVDPESPTPVSGNGDVSSLGEYELAEYIKANNLTVNQVIALAGDDKDLAHRLLQAENIATEGEPRKGVEAGLTTIIESS